MGSTPWRLDACPPTSKRDVIASAYRIDTAVSVPELWAMNRIPCALNASCPPAGYVHTWACDARSTA